MNNHTSTTPLEDMAAARAVNANNQCLKVFVQRDYSEGTLVKFQTRFPTELEERIERQAFEYTVNQLNAIYAEAEKAGCSTYCEEMKLCPCLRKVAKFVVEQNERVYAPRGLLITDPTERGLRVIEISILNEPAATRT
ncbi:Golgin subfamily A member 7B [Blattella germanica]|nr:Golgin subfamily A member 7B [Blattella germanica]